MTDKLDKPDKLLELLEQANVYLNDKEKRALKFCFGKQGPFKGYLKERSPRQSDYPLAWVIYNAIQPNPERVQSQRLLRMSPEQKTLYKRLTEFTYPHWLDKDLTEQANKQTEKTNAIS